MESVHQDLLVKMRLLQKDMVTSPTPGHEASTPRKRLSRQSLDGFKHPFRRHRNNSDHESNGRPEELHALCEPHQAAAFAKLFLDKV